MRNRRLKSCDSESQMCHKSFTSCYLVFLQNNIPIINFNFMPYSKIMLSSNNFHLTDLTHEF